MKERARTHIGVEDEAVLGEVLQDAELGSTQAVGEVGLRGEGRRQPRAVELERELKGRTRPSSRELSMKRKPIVSTRSYGRARRSQSRRRSRRGGEERERT